MEQKKTLHFKLIKKLMDGRELTAEENDLWAKISESARKTTEAMEAEKRREAEANKNLAAKYDIVNQLAVDGVRSEITMSDFDIRLGSKLCKWAIEQPALFSQMAKTQASYYLFGGVGCGKTVYLKALAIRDAIEANGKFIQFMRTMDEIRQHNWANKEHIVGQLKNCTTLYIDDLGSDDPIIGEEQVIMDILDYRLHRHDNKGRKFRTIITANRHPDQLRFSDRIKDRIKRAGYVFQVSKLSEGIPETC